MAHQTEPLTDSSAFGPRPSTPSAQSIMRSLRSSTLLPLLLLSASAGAGDRIAASKPSAATLAATFAPASSTACPSAAKPCAAPTSSTVPDFPRLVGDVLDARTPRTLRFAETGTRYELRGETDHVREASPDGGERQAQRARRGQARYR